MCIDEAGGRSCVYLNVAARINFGIEEAAFNNVFIHDTIRGRLEIKGRGDLIVHAMLERTLSKP